MIFSGELWCVCLYKIYECFLTDSDVFRIKINGMAITSLKCTYQRFDQS